MKVGLKRMQLAKSAGAFMVGPWIWIRGKEMVDGIVDGNDDGDGAAAVRSLV